MVNNPKLTVLMPVFNAGKYIREAVDSVLSQTFRDFKLLIINDGSIDATQSILETYKDPRIQIITHKRNRGIVKCLNEGLSFVKGTYIARMDADDIALPSRLEKQVVYMDKHPGIAVCGSWLKAIFDTKSEIWKAPVAHSDIRALMLFHDAIFHPTVIMRAETIKKYNFRYSSLYSYAEDYELWTRIMKYSSLANLPEVLLYHRIQQKKYVDDYLKIQQKSADTIRLSQLHHLGIRPSKSEFSTHVAISMGKNKRDKLSIMAARRWLIKLLMANFKTNQYPHFSFAKMIARKWIFEVWGVRLS